MQRHQQRPSRRLAVALGTALALVALGAGAVSAGGSGALIVRGTQLAYGTCDDPDTGAPGYLMTDGSLDGCWVIDTFDVRPVFAGKHNYVATGTEHFTGWIGNRHGTFTTRYTFTAKTDGPWDEGAAEIHGRCHHPITGGSGGFAGITGQLSFTDINDTPPSYPYWGAIRLPGGAATLTTRTAATTSATAGGTTC